ncbi:MAG: hypothetical protein ACOC7S_00780 [Planctomycetota bacterium]
MKNFVGWKDSDAEYNQAMLDALPYPGSPVRSAREATRAASEADRRRRAAAVRRQRAP